MKKNRIIFTIVLIVMVSIPILSQTVNRPPGSSLCVSIIPTDGRPCVFTPQWNEWQIEMFARVELCYYGPQSNKTLTYVSAPVTWYRKFYGYDTYEFWTTSNSEQNVGSDGHRCKNGDPLHDKTWQTTYKAVVNDNGVERVAYLTVGDPAAETYPCCLGSNCNPPSPPPCQ